MLPVAAIMNIFRLFSTIATGWLLVTGFNVVAHAAGSSSGQAAEASPLAEPRSLSRVAGAMDAARQLMARMAVAGEGTEREEDDEDHDDNADNADNEDGDDEAKAEARQRDQKKDAKAEKPKTIADVVEDSEVFEGLFKLYRHPESGKVWMEIHEDQLEQEFIYFAKATDGVSGSGHVRGMFRGTKILQLKRHFERIEWVEENTRFYFDPQSPLARAADANISPAVLASLSIEAEEGGRLLVEVGPLFLQENLLQVKRGRGDNQLLGDLSSDRTKFTRLASYPENTDVEVEYVYQNREPSGSFDEDVTDPRAVSVRIKHTLIEMPRNDYSPRRDDARVGYFMTRVTDLSSVDPVPWRDHIHRWHLVKEKPGAELSEPVEPIVWWMENTTPLEFRDTIQSAALRWNEAFEAIGFKDAIVIRQQPDDADWEADDVRYNVLRWTSSPNPPWGGYGPSFVNPRTGQILGSDVMLEYSFISARVLQRQVFEDAGLADWNQVPDPDESAWPEELRRRAAPAGRGPGHDPHCHQCAAGLHLAHGFLAGLQVLQLQDAIRPDKEQLVKEALHYLVLHELGHTLGLSHNFKASHLHDADQIHDAERTGELGVTASVMDYPAVNLAPEGFEQGQYFTTGPGPYDYWAIEYGYSEGLQDPRMEDERLEGILQRSNEPELAFANDADDMRSPGKGIDPRAMTFSLSSDPITYSERRCRLMRENLSLLLERGTTEGRSFDDVRRGYFILSSELERALHPVSRYVGGVYVERLVVGQDEDTRPLRPVPAEDQRRAMAVLAEHAFAPDAFEVSPELLQHLQAQRRGWDFDADGEDPKLHDRVLRIQNGLLSHLLHPNTQRRILDTQLYGNEYSLSEMMSDLTSAVVDENPQAATNSFRQNLQVDFVGHLFNLKNNNGVPPAVRSVALYEIKRVQTLFEERMEAGLDPAEQAHAGHVLYLIRRGLDE